MALKKSPSRIVFEVFLYETRCELAPRRTNEHRALDRRAHVDELSRNPATSARMRPFIRDFGTFVARPRYLNEKHTQPVPR